MSAKLPSTEKVLAVLRGNPGPTSNAFLLEKYKRCDKKALQMMLFQMVVDGLMHRDFYRNSVVYNLPAEATGLELVYARPLPEAKTTRIHRGLRALATQKAPSSPICKSMEARQSSNWLTFVAGQPARSASALPA
jgi:hypothetical protein